MKIKDINLKGASAAWIFVSLMFLAFICFFLLGMLVGGWIQQVNMEQWLYIRDTHMRYCTMNSSILDQGENVALFVDSVYPNGTIIWKQTNATTLEVAG